MVSETTQVAVDAEAEDYARRLNALSFQGPGLVEALFLSPCPDVHQAVTQLRMIPEVGVEGQYPGKQWWQGKRVPGRQVSAMNAEVLEALEIPFDVPGDNVIVRGFDLARLEPGDVLRIGDALLIVTPTPHRPCAKFAWRTSQAKKMAISLGTWRGVLLDARRPATIAAGDTVEQIVLT